MRPRSSLSLLVAAGASLLVSACDDDSAPRIEAGGEELWLLQTRVFGLDETTMGYVIPTTTLDGNISNDAAIEQGGGGMVYAPSNRVNGNFLLSYAERGTLTRYDVTTDNRFVEGTTLSFSSYGVESGYGVIAFVDDSTAYWIDNQQLQVIRFNPTTMLIDAAIPVQGTEREGFITEFSGYPVVRDDGVYFTARWRKEWEDPMPQAPAGAMLIHIDPATNAVSVTEDARCTSLLVSHTTPRGDTYWFSDNYNTYARIIGGAERGVPDCSLRLLRDQTTFDPDWYLDLGERTGGRPADGVIAGSGSTIWMSVFHAEQLGEQPADIDTADTARAWQWYSLDVESDAPAVEDTARPYASHGAFGWYSSVRSFSSTTNDDYSESVLLELTNDGFEQRATVEGLIDGIVRVR
ncbi:MAG TPA: hypothetical protein VMG12_03445 [Polyangiaceae bacterium]|nr:hypothetical protein [Polyangiaceae bacterium]